MMPRRTGRTANGPLSYTPRRTIIIASVRDDSNQSNHDKIQVEMGPSGDPGGARRPRARAGLGLEIHPGPRVVAGARVRHRAETQATVRI
jgi:hypothetical protein